MSLKECVLKKNFLFFYKNYSFKNIGEKREKKGKKEKKKERPRERERESERERAKERGKKS